MGEKEWEPACGHNRGGGRWEGGADPTSEAHGGQRFGASRAGSPGAAWQMSQQRLVVRSRGEAIKTGEAEADRWAPATVPGLNPVN
jgi:hypothetical protein